MGHIPDDDSFEEFMDASAEEWSKPEEPPEIPDPSPEPTDRWGSSTADKTVVNDGDRWGSEAIEPTIKKEKPKEEKPKQAPAYKPPVKEEKKKPKWWIIVIIVLVVLCLCACISVVVLSILGFINMDWSMFETSPIPELFTP